MLLRLGQNLLLKGLGDCQFASANARFEFDGGSDWSTAFAVSYLGMISSRRLQLAIMLIAAPPDLRGEPVQIICFIDQ